MAQALAACFGHSFGESRGKELKHVLKDMMSKTEFLGYELRKRTICYDLFGISAIASESNSRPRKESIGRAII